MPENYKIDYGNLPHDIQLLGERVRQTAQNFRDSVDEQFPEIRIKQEQEKIRQEEKEKIDRLPWHSKLGYHLMTVPQDGTLPLYTRSAADRMMVGDFAGAEAIQKPVNTVGAIATGMGLLGAAGLADLIATTGTYGLGTALAAEGLSWGTGTAGYYGGNWLGQKIDNKHGTNITPWLSILTSIGGGAAGYSGVLRSSPSMIKRMLNEAKKMDWTPEGIVIPDKAPKWKWSRNAQYDHTSKTLELPLFARKSQIGHELGHYIGDVGVADPAMVKGAFVPGYKYSDNASFELNSAEAFADHFKTKLGYPYKGTNKNLVSRQNALNDDIEFYDVTRESARSYELPLEEKLGIPKHERSNPKALEDPQYWGYEQWNERYNAAIKSGNWEEAQRLRDLHFKRNAPDTKIVDENGMPKHMYHGRYLWDRSGWTKTKINNLFTKFKGVNFDLEDAVDEGSVLNHWSLSKPNRGRMNSYHTPEYNVARRVYAAGNPRGVMDNYLYIKNPANWNEVEQIIGKRGISDWSDFKGGKKDLMELGYDGLYIPQYYDSYGVFVSPSQFKSADPITWNGKGEIIPIVKRDNFRNLDTRYQQGGKIK